jgi:hypothetical protein
VRRRRPRPPLPAAALAALALACGAASGAGARGADRAARGAAPEPATCQDLRDAYGAELARAQACDPAAPDACAATRPGALQDPCGCPVAVDPGRTAGLDRLLAAFRSRGCPPDRPVCNRACVLPAARCAPGSTGQPTCAAR